MSPEPQFAWNGDSTVAYEVAGDGPVDLAHVPGFINNLLVEGSRLVFQDRGEHELKGVPDRWRFYRVVD